MFIHDLFVKRKSRSFGFIPFYYKKEDGKEVGEGAPRIRFRRLRTGVTVGRKSVRSRVILAIFFLVMLIYFWRLIERDLSTSELENIRIEEIPNGH